MQVTKIFMIAYFILVHRYPKQFKRLFKAIYDENNFYLVHIDKKSGDNLFNDLEDFLCNLPNVYLLKSQNVVWGGYSMVEAEIRGMKRLLDLSKSWDFFINLSGQDFPLKSQFFIKNFLKSHLKKDFLLVSNQILKRYNTLNRIENYFVETSHGFSGSPYKRPFLKNVIPYIGGQWKILSRSSCEFICSSSKVVKFKRYYRNTLIPDESFFQTVLMNSGFQKKIVNDDKRAIIWIPDIDSNLAGLLNRESTEALVASGKIKLRPKTFTTEDISFLFSSKAFFARKFDETIDATILDMLESKLKAYGKHTIIEKNKRELPQVPSLAQSS